MKTSIVIPIHNRWDLVHSLLNDVQQKLPKVHEVIAVDDASTDDDVVQGLMWWKRYMPLPLKIKVQEEDMGFLKTANNGVKAAEGDVIVLVSTDVRIRHNLFEMGTEVDFEHTIYGARYLDFDTGWNRFGSRIFPYLEGWLLVFSKKAWDDIGGFDERYAPNDYEDVDFSTAALNKGYSLVELQRCAEHIGCQSIGFSPERAHLTLRNQRKFADKWLIK